LETPNQEVVLFWPTVIFVATFVGSLALFLAIVVMLPAKYFATTRRGFLSDKSPLVRWMGLIGKNALGVGLIVLGVLLSLPLMPGQGLFTIAIGLMLVDLPGKHRLVQRIVKRPGVLKTLNWIRGWFGRPALVVEE
jgi:hypothetical protein